MKLNKNEYYLVNGKLIKNKAEALHEHKRTGIRLSYYDINRRKKAQALTDLRQ